MGYEDQIKVLLAIIQSQAKQIEELCLRLDIVEKENYELRRRLNQDSSNSSKPPSSDSIFKKSTRPSRKKSKGKPGGQVGHKGHRLKKFETVDFYEDHFIEQCPMCRCEHLELTDHKVKQVVDIPEPQIEVTEHYVYAYQCSDCGQQVYSDHYHELKQEVQYGPRIKGLVSYLSVYQLIPYKRLTELIETIYGHKISQGSISNFNKNLSDQLSSFIKQVKRSLSESKKAIHCDETSCMVSKSLSWMHVYSDQTRTLLEGHIKRGKQAIEDIGILSQAKGIVVHDRFRSYSSYDQATHSLCNAHLLRNLKSIEEKDGLKWPRAIIKLLLRAKHYKDNNDLSPKRAKRLQLQYESILRKQRSYYNNKETLLKSKQKRKGNYKREADQNLYRDLWKYRNQILRFMYDQDVPFDNNLAERDLRMVKVKMKISNQFKTVDWMNVYAVIRSFISTAQKQEKNILKCIINAYSDPKSPLQLAV